MSAYLGITLTLAISILIIAMMFTFVPLSNDDKENKFFVRMTLILMLLSPLWPVLLSLIVLYLLYRTLRFALSS